MKIDLPAVHAGLRRRPQEGRLRLPAVCPNKIVRTEWLAKGGDAATFIKNFKWGNADQNSVADAITNKKLSAEDAAKAVDRRATRPLAGLDALTS